MDFKRSSQPQARRAEDSQPTPVASSHPYAPVGRPHGVVAKVIALVITLLLLAGIAAALWMAFLKPSGYVGIKSNQYQAVFLTNGQVYFGKLSESSDSQVKISNIYYLQVQQKVQPAETNASSKDNQVSLAKLGEELHGPEDTMFISKDQVLFWENLKDNSKVVEAIKNAK